MAYTDSTNYNTVKSMKGFPVGSIIPWSAQIDDIPYGWVACGGSTFPIARYPLLHQAIGNVYGGTEGSTFKLPNLNDGFSAIMDIYQGHFQYLQSFGEAHRPQNTNITLDSFWNNVGKGDNGNKPANIQTNWISTIDVVGEQITKPDVVAKHNVFQLSGGDVSYTIAVNERKLSDRHVANHDHAFETDGDPSYDRTNIPAAANFGWNRQFCVLNATSASVTRSVNDPPIDGTQMANVGASFQVPTNFRRGGGDIINDGTFFDAQTQATGFSNGDGVSGGDMWSNRNGTKYFWSSLSNNQISFSQIPGHTHDSLELNWVSKIKLINPGIVSDVKMNNVAISNTPGINFGTINMNSATASCGMTFIIKAF
jgi:microcystin-dependent protein